MLLPSQIFNGRKTDQCGVITFGSEGTPPQGYNFYFMGLTYSCQKLITLSMTKMGATKTYSNTFQLVNPKAIPFLNLTNCDPPPRREMAS